MTLNKNPQPVLQILSKKAFADLLGKNKATITKWAQAGFLVLTDNKKVRVKQSVEKLIKHKGAKGVSIVPDELLKRLGIQNQLANQTKKTQAIILDTQSQSPVPEGLDISQYEAYKIQANVARKNLEEDLAKGESLIFQDVEQAQKAQLLVIKRMFEGGGDALASIIPSKTIKQKQALILEKVEQFKTQLN